MELLYKRDIISVSSNKYDNIKVLVNGTLVCLESEEYIYALLLLLPLACTRER